MAKKTHRDITSTSPGEAVLHLVQEHRQKAADMERFAPDVARVLREAADDYEAVVLATVPEWWTLSAIRATKGWSMKTLRRRAERLQDQRQARKGKNGQWEIRWDAVHAMSRAPSRTAEIDASGDLDDLAYELAMER